MSHVFEKRLTVLLSSIFLLSCATHVSLSGAQPEYAATIFSVGDLGFRIDRTVHNTKPTPYVIQVDGKATAKDGWPSSVSMAAGEHSLLVLCVLSPDEAIGSPVPFARLANGVGVVVSNRWQQAQAHIPLTATLEASGMYELRCESLRNLTARAWITKI